MSKIGQANLALQEQAQNLGFDSMQEAVDNGYKAMYREHGMKLEMPEKAKTWALVYNTPVEAYLVTLLSYDMPTVNEAKELLNKRFDLTIQLSERVTVDNITKPMFDWAEGKL